MLRDARTAQRVTQQRASQRAGLSQSTWSYLEIGGDGRTTLATWSCAALAVGGRLDAYVRQASAADVPRDAVHLRNQELIIRTALDGGWSALPEQQIDRHAATSRSADVLLHRRRASPEYALVEVVDWFDDVGRVVRDWDRRLAAVEAYAIARMLGDDAMPISGGCWVVRATQRNRRLLAEHRHFFHARFPGSGRAWLQALTDRGHSLPAQPAMLWASVSGERLFPARLR